MARDNSYIYGSVAPKLSSPAEKPIEQQRVIKKEKTHVVPQKHHIPKSRLFFAIAFTVGVCFIILYRFCIISEMNTKMGVLNAKYNELQDENRKLNVAIETSIDLDRVREIAQTKLNMHAPDQNQLVLVNVPKSNYSVVMNYDYIDESGQKSSLVENILNLAKGVLP